MKKYDVIVIGTGGGGKITSPAARMGLKVAVIEKTALGGTCLNRGCIPSKMLIHPANVAHQIKQAHRYGIVVPREMDIRFDELVGHISSTVDTDSARIVSGYTKNPNIDLYQTEAKFLSNKVIRAGHEELTADKIFIAVGARPSIPDIKGLKDTPYMTSTEALRNNRLPKRMIIIGGGYIAVELGHAYGALGTEVHFLVRDCFLRGEDRQVAEEFTRVFSETYAVHRPAVPVGVDYFNGQFTVEYLDAERSSQRLTADSLLIATGVTPNSDTLDLHKTDIEVRDNGLIKVNDYFETAVPGVYAFGDCVGNYFFRHSVNFEGEYLFKRLFLKTIDTPVRYPHVPHAVFSHPQIAGVGKTEEELKAEGVDYVVGLNPYKNSAMGMALRSTHGFCKILIDRSSRKILGAHIVGEEASNMIHMLIAFMSKDGTLDDLLNMIYIHPALPEIVRNAARKAEAAFHA